MLLGRSTHHTSECCTLLHYFPTAAADTSLAPATSPPSHSSCSSTCLTQLRLLLRLLTLSFHDSAVVLQSQSSGVVSQSWLTCALHDANGSNKVSRLENLRMISK